MVGIGSIVSTGAIVGDEVGVLTTREGGADSVSKFAHATLAMASTPHTTTTIPLHHFIHLRIAKKPPLDRWTAPLAKSPGSHDMSREGARMRHPPKSTHDMGVDDLARVNSNYIVHD